MGIIIVFLFALAVLSAVVLGVYFYTKQKRKKADSSDILDAGLD